MNDSSEFNWIICHRADEVYIGTVSLYRVDMENRSAEFGRLLIGDRRFLGRGLAEDASQQVIEHASKLKLKTINLEVKTDNTRAKNLYERLGFRSIEEVGGYTRQTLIL